MLRVRETWTFAVTCHSRVDNEVAAPYEEGEGSQAHFLGEITDVGDSNDAWTVKLPIQGIEINFKINSGADTSVISEKTFNKLKHKPQQARKLESPEGTLDCMGHFIATTVWKEKRFRFKVNVLKGSHSSHPLSRNVAAAMGLIKRIVEIKSAEQLKDPYPEEVGKLNIKPIKVTLKEDAIPYSVTTARHVSVPMLPKVKRARTHGNQWSDTANQRADGVCSDGCCTKEKPRPAKDMC